MQEERLLLILLQAELAALKIRTNTLEIAVETCCGIILSHEAPFSVSNAVLGDDFPNPFDELTIIQYFLPSSAGSGTVEIVNGAGVLVRSIQLTGYGNGHIILSTDGFESGSYTYSMVVDGQVIDSKNMMVTK